MSKFFDGKIIDSLETIRFDIDLEVEAEHNEFINKIGVESPKTCSIKKV